MRVKVFIISLLIIPLYVTGQLHTLSDQYIFNGLAINPAYAGSNEAFSAVVSYRNQWVGFNGAPKTVISSFHSPLGNELIGIGLLVINDQIGVNNETSIMANYAYMIKMGAGRLSFGVGAGISLLNADWDALKVTDITDTELIHSSFNVTNPNFSTGIYYRNQEFFLGLSSPLFLSYSLNPTTKKLSLSNDLSEYNIYISSGYIFEINERIKFYPSGLAKFHPGNGVQIDLYPQIILRDVIWLGIGYRSIDSFIAMFQLQFTNQIRMAYSYDFDIGETFKYNYGSHELMVKYVFNIKSKVDGPARF